MSDKRNIYKIVKLIYKKNFSSINSIEENEMDKWLAIDEENKNILKRLSEESNIPKHIGELSSYDGKNAFARFEERVNKKDRKILLYKNFIRYAAIFIVPIFLGSLIYYLSNSFIKENSGLLTENTIIPPGKSKATLLMADGNKVILSNISNIDLVEKDSTLIKADSTYLDYSQSNVGKGSEDGLSQQIMNTLVIPRQGEYQLILEDGTKVWINSDSKLIYPTRFGKTSRCVVLEGEAYFEVTKDKKRPFIVRSGETEVKVLGTEFNINAYPDNENIMTTLVNGKVAFSQKIQKQKKEVVLVPGQQAIVNKGVAGIDVKKVNTLLYTAWKDGRFVFENESFDNIMKILGRWYDVEVFFQNNSLKELRFSGDLERFDNINSHLKMLGMTTNVSFSIKGKVVWVRENYYE